MTENNGIKALVSNWKLHLTILVITIISELIGMQTIPVGFGNIMFLPLLYGLAMALILALAKPISWISKEQSELADKFIVTGIALFGAKIGINSGAAIMDVIQAGPALLLQELGNLGTIFLALPVALLLGFKREAVGMTNSIGREPNIGLIADKYGMNSPEGRGIMITYVVGTLVGTIFMGALSSLLATATPLHPYALAMACGVGSGSLMAASVAPLAETFPQMADQITAYAGVSNVLSTADGIFLTMFVGLPICNFMYKKLEPKIGRTTKATVSAASVSEEE